MKVVCTVFPLRCVNCKDHNAGFARIPSSNQHCCLEFLSRDLATCERCIEWPTIQLERFHFLTTEQTQTKRTLTEPTMGDTNNRQRDCIEDGPENTPPNGQKTKQESKGSPKTHRKTNTANSILQTPSTSTSTAPSPSAPPANPAATPSPARTTASPQNAPSQEDQHR